MTQESVPFGGETYHGVNQALVAIPQIGCEPSRGLVDGLIGPCAVGKVYRRKLPVLFGGVLKPATHSQEQVLL